MVYLDYNATTPLAPEVIDVITESLREAWGNPSSSHELGCKAKEVISLARTQVANMIGANISDIIFTSGGTEGNNWILQMAVKYYHETFKIECIGDTNNKTSRPHFITSNIEHDSIKLVLDHFQSEGIADVTFVPVRTTTGAVDVQDILAAIRPSTIMITVMLANNETGVLQPVSDICHQVKSLKRNIGETKRILLHTDAAQAIGKVSVNVEDLGVDYLTVVGHKFYAPRIGAIFAKNPGQTSPIYPLLFGGGQERNFRPGTENTPMIAGLGKAAQLVFDNVGMYHSHMLEIRNYLELKLIENFQDSVCFNGKFQCSERLPNTCNVSFIGSKSIKGHEILSNVPSLQASVGAACHAQNRPSSILLAIGVPEAVAWSALRISVGRETRKEDIDSVIQDLVVFFNQRKSLVQGH
ncbi:selenocysteine lyase-like [Biomphalaria glabrata]|uniref:Selenocysteine lyase n=1 Tax=Biomphalaria glabrata TaxID=6526 RepID=A0A9W2YLH1_BIOGL|nr:selenocysteine lyase-like [Biomphalaria glabrata]XP_055863584.1 selenocysteine lyase-like [Biomphalaria glabrata]XP_055863585.1 selenocysteine lyase-like [Biomphalaria glabrata]